ncbi:hypothetical protein [Haloactinomyces albus]|uniref:Uncharacterized protein n=1 Tax=Haloactinomyces albus TaxID=1352928 RepID=A0AAE4CPA1_9ACTN|nr:hypothetical protein [Haloactinomyces albus]MDR7304211.1 hypothetical protein [Haloactinomyces albus]
MPQHPTNTSIDAFKLLQDSEQFWRQDPLASLRCDGSADSQHRRRLLFQALCAYERLRAEQAPETDPLTVFRRWPACTLVTMVGLAASATDRRAYIAELAQLLTEATGDSNTAAPSTNPRVAVEPWLRGWAQSWYHLIDDSSLGERLSAYEVPGLGLLLAATGIAVPDVGVPELRLGIATGTVSVTISGGHPHKWSVHADGVACPLSGDRWIMPHPAATVECRDLFGNTRTLPAVDPANPLLIFDDDGRLIPSDESVKESEAWLLHRGKPSPEAFEGEQRILEESVAPPGWPRWWLGKVLLDRTRAVRSMQHSDADGTRFGPWRRVEATKLSSGKPVFESDSAVPALYDSDGDPVYATAPRLRLPGEGSDSWEVEITEDSTGQETSSYLAHSGEAVDLADLLPQPAVGSFRLRATAPDKQQINKKFTVAEGIEVESKPRLRMLRDDGSLYSANVAITTQAGMRAVPDSVHLSASTIGHWSELHLTGEHGAVLHLWVQPPHTALCKRIQGRPGAWETKPLSFPLHELHDSAQLDLSLPKSLREEYAEIPGLIAHDDTGTVAQHLDGSRVSSTDVIRYNLSSLTDTVGTHGSLRLQLKLPTQEAHVADVYIPRPASGVRCDSDRLQLINRIPAKTLRVSVHALFAPWVTAQTQELPEGTDELVLRAPFRHGGPLLVTVLPTGTEIPNDRPSPAELPRSGAMFRVGDENQVPALPSSAAQQMASYLAGHSPLPEEIDALPLLWVTAARADVSPSSALGRRTAQECAARLGATPTSSLMTATEARLTMSELVATLIRSGLAAHCFRHVTDPSQIRPMWEKAPLPALLLTSPLLPYLSDDPQWDRAELEPEEEYLLNELSQRCASLALDVLTGRRGPPAETDSPPLLSEARSATATAAATRSLSDIELPEEPMNYLVALQSFATTSGYTPLFEVLHRRGAIGDDQQAQIATLSLGSALVARIAAQGDSTAARVEQRLRPAWVEIATHVAELAADDLVLAEFLANRRYTPEH